MKDLSKLDTSRSTKLGWLTELLASAFSALSHRDYRLLWIGAFFSNVGSWIQKVGQPWLILSLTGSPLLLGIDGFMQDAPLLLFLLVGGAISDRFDKRKILIFSQIVQGTSALMLAALVATGHITVWTIIALSFIVGCVQSLSTPAYLSTLPALVPPEHITNAIALNSMQFNLSRFIGPAIGGVVVASLGVAWCFGLNALSYLALLIVLPLIQFPPASTQVISLTSLRESIAEGVQEVRRRPELLSVTITVFFVSFFAGPILNFIPAIAKENLQAEAGGFSLMLSAFGAGAVLGALRVAVLRDSRQRYQIVLGSSGILAGAVAAIALSHLFLLSLALMFVSGFALVSCGSVGNTIMQTGVEEQLRGRVISIYATAFRGGLPLGSLLTGVLSEHFSAATALLCDGIALFAVLGIIWYIFAPRLVQKEVADSVQSSM
ncbi:MAG: MFS transporter [Chloroherpetonaceae bacterium]|nr:MFS transporter [Chloroherpetonaceae bacterium]MCS7210337.1 MFS transporter [Chloroherpetonaceae bacterium]MDW8019076.1 MFS transporter [Chloroherpetonaceae bacterium]